MQAAWWRDPGILYFAAMGLVCPAVAQQFHLASVSSVGPAITNCIGGFVPAFAAIIALAFLGETLNLQGWLGMLVLVAALCLTPFATNGIARGWALPALLLPLGAAAIRGIMQPVTKVGLDAIPSPFFSTLVMTSVSSVVLFAAILVRGKAGTLVRLSPGYRWFVAAGAILGGGTFCLQGALGLGEVITVAPVAATTPLWTVLFGYLLYGRDIGWRVAGLAVAVVFGAVLIIAR